MSSASKIEFIIEKDGNGISIDLDKMSVPATESFLILVQKLIQIVSAKTSTEATFQIRRGSAVVGAEVSEMVIDDIENDFDKILSGESSDKDSIEPWRDLQNLFKQNGLYYKVFFHSKRGVRSVADEIKKNKTFRVKKRTNTLTFVLEFLKGKLISVGGKSPNIHLAPLDGKTIVISCTEAEALKINRFLYQEIHVSVLLKKQYNQVLGTPQLCDFYHSSELFETYSNIYKEYLRRPPIDRLDYLYESVEMLLSDKNIGNVAKLLRLYNSESCDVSTLKTLLIVTNGFKDHDAIKDIRGQIQTMVDLKLSE